MRRLLFAQRKKIESVTLRISEDDFNVVENFAKAKGLSVSAYINSVIKSQTEYFIPLASNEKVSIPKSICIHYSHMLARRI